MNAIDESAVRDHYELFGLIYGFAARRGHRATLTRSLSEAELRRALAAAITVTVGEVQQSDPALAARLRPMLTELADTNHGPDLGHRTGSGEWSRVPCESDAWHLSGRVAAPLRYFARTMTLMIMIHGLDNSSAAESVW